MRNEYVVSDKRCVRLRCDGCGEVVWVLVKKGRKWVCPVCFGVGK